MSFFLKKDWWIISVIFILFVAIFLRFYKLGVVPHGMFWDEAAVGYNGYSIVKTRRDEWLEKLPISFKSFGDFKAPLGIYLNGVFTILFGMNLWAVRFPFALFSILGIFGSILLAKEVFKKNKYQKIYSIIVGVLMTTSPWNFLYSRTGFDNGLAQTFLIWSLLLFLIAMNSKFQKYWASLTSSLLFGLSIYAYHSSKMVVPLLLLVFAVMYFKDIRRNIKKLLLPGILFVSLMIPFVKDSIFGDGLTRAGVTIFSSDLSFVNKIGYIFSSYISHLSPSFLVLGDATTLRHTTGYMGVLLFTTYILVIFGALSTFKKRDRIIYDKNKCLFFLLILIGLLPACIALEVPHSSRSSLALPGFIFIAVYGLDYLISIVSNSKLNKEVEGSHGENNFILISVVGTIMMLHILLSISYFSNYFTTYAKESANSFQDGYLEAFKIAVQYEKGDGVEEVDKIIFTSDYGQPYIYALFVRKTNPIWYHGGSLIKYEFADKIDINDLTRDNALIVGSYTDDLPIENADYIVNGSDGKMRFQIYKTNKN